MRAAGQNIYHLGFGESPFAIPDCMQDALKENVGRGEYLPVEGKQQKALHVTTPLVYVGTSVVLY